MFLKRDLGMVCSLISCRNSITKRIRNSFDLITACCVLFWRLSSASKWYDLELVFWMKYSTLSEIFLELMEHFFVLRIHLFTKLTKDCNILDPRSTRGLLWIQDHHPTPSWALLSAPRKR